MSTLVIVSGAALLAAGLVMLTIATSPSRGAGNRTVFWIVGWVFVFLGALPLAMLGVDYIMDMFESALHHTPTGWIQG